MTKQERKQHDQVCQSLRTGKIDTELGSGRCAGCSVTSPGFEAWKDQTPGLEVAKAIGTPVLLSKPGLIKQH